MKLIYSLAFGVATFFALNCGSGDEGGGGYSSSSSSKSANDPSVVEVKVNGHDFSPAEIHIKANQTVRWVWVAGTHNVLSGTACVPDGTFSSGSTASAPKTFEHTFEKTGSFPYFCDPHCSIGMTGKVIVD